jgi:hypothetical protein
VGSAGERFVQAVRLASYDLNVKTEGGQGRDPSCASLNGKSRTIDFEWKHVLPAGFILELITGRNNIKEVWQLARRDLSPG